MGITAHNLFRSMIYEVADEIKDETFWSDSFWWKGFWIQTIRWKRKSIRVGDDILFSEIGSGRKVLVEVVGLLKASTFKELELKLKNNDGVIFNANEMYEYYTQSDEIKYGVLGIKIKVISK